MYDFVKKILLGSLLSSCVLFADSEIHIMGVGTALDYKEYGATGELLDSESSNLGDVVGIELGYGYLYKDGSPWMTKIDLKYMRAAGTTQYVGSELGSNQGYGSVVSTTDNTIDEFSIVLKEIYAVNELFNMKAGIGIGFYQWERTLSSFQNEIYSWYPLRFEIGTTFRLEKDSPINFDLSFAYKKGLNPIMELESPYIEFTLGDVKCYEFSLYVVYKLTQQVHLVGGYIINTQDITRSNVVQGFYEPDSKDKQNFLKLGVQYAF